MKYWIAWMTYNNKKVEGVIFDNEEDAISAKTGKRNRRRGYPSVSSIAENFYETYGEEGEITIQEVELP